MSNARIILVILICTAPVILLLDGPIIHGVVAGVAGVGIAVVSRTMRPREAAFYLSFARAAAVVLIIPAVWVLIQVLPLPAFAHPIWASAETGIGHPILGSISIDLGASVMALGQYITIVAIAFWSAAVAVDRQRAEWILFSLMAATTLIGLVLIADRLFELTALDAANALLERTQAVDCAVMGIIIAAAAGIRTLERYETRHASSHRSVLFRNFAASVASLAICGGALMLDARDATLMVAGYGVAVLLGVIFVRRIGLGPYGRAAIALPIIGTAVFFIASNPGLRTTSFTLAFATESPPSLTSMSQRILSDAPLIGTGAGTFAAIAPIYRDINDQTAVFTPPTAAVAVAVELGRPMLWIIVATMMGSIVILLRASLRRGRDSFYPTAGAGCLVTLLFLCFLNAGSFGTAAAMIAAATLGLAFAQSKSRSTQQ